MKRKSHTAVSVPQAESRRCCTNRDWPARCQSTGSLPADAIRHWSAEGGHPIQDRSAALYMGTLVATRYNPLIQRFYYRLVAAGKPKKLAVSACMRKLLTILKCDGAIQLGVAARSRVVIPRTGLTPKAVVPKRWNLRETRYDSTSLPWPAGLRA